MRLRTLVIGNRNYSSWSMRAWLLLRWLDLPFEEIVVGLYREDSRERLLRFSPTAKVPVLLEDDLTLWDTHAIIDHLAERRPDIWPDDRARRAYARSICGEMHSGFTALREAMPYNARGRGRRATVTAAVAADVERIQHIWTDGRARFGEGGDYLLGGFGIADIMFAPVASRFRTYDVALRPEVEPYWRTLLDHPLCRLWFAAGEAESEVIPACELGQPPG